MTLRSRWKSRMIPRKLIFFWIHECCPRYTTEKRTKVGTGQKSFGEPESLPGTGITDRRAAHPEGPAWCWGKPGALRPKHSTRRAEAWLRAGWTQGARLCVRSVLWPTWWAYSGITTKVPAGAAPSPQAAGAGGGARPAPSPRRTTVPKMHRKSKAPAPSLPCGDAVAAHPGSCSSPVPLGGPRPITVRPVEDSPPRDAARHGYAERGAPPATVAVPGAAGERGAAAGGPRAQAVGHVRERRRRRGRPGRGRRRSGRRRGRGRRGLRLGARRHRPGLAAARRRAAYRHHRGAAQEPRPVRRLPPGLPGRRGHQGSAAEPGGRGCRAAPGARRRDEAGAARPVSLPQAGAAVTVPGPRPPLAEGTPASPPSLPSVSRLRGWGRPPRMACGSCSAALSVGGVSCPRCDWHLSDRLPWRWSWLEAVAALRRRNRLENRLGLPFSSPGLIRKTVSCKDIAALEHNPHISKTFNLSFSSRCSQTVVWNGFLPQSHELLSICWQYWSWVVQNCPVKIKHWWFIFTNFYAFSKSPVLGPAIVVLGHSSNCHKTISETVRSSAQSSHRPEQLCQGRYTLPRADTACLLPTLSFIIPSAYQIMKFKCCHPLVFPCTVPGSGWSYVSMWVC